MLCVHVNNRVHILWEGPAFPSLIISWGPSPLCRGDELFQCGPIILVLTNISLFRFPFSYFTRYDLILWGRARTAF